MRRLLPRQHVSGEGRGTSPPAWEQYRKHQKKCRTQHERDDNDTNDVDRVASGSTPQTRPDDATSKGKGREKENGKKKEKDDGDESHGGDATESALHNSSRRVQELFNEFQNPFWLLLADVTDAEFDKLVDYLETIEAETE